MAYLTAPKKKPRSSILLSSIPRQQTTYEEEEGTTSDELLSNYKQRLEASGIETPELETHRGGNSVWNFLKSTLNALNAPANLIASVTAELLNPEKYEGNVLTAAKEGLLNQRHTSFSNVLEDMGVENKWVKVIGGLGLDILTDPLTYIGVGSLTKAGKATKLLGQTAETALGFIDEIPDVLKLVDEVPDLARAAQALKTAADTGGDVKRAVNVFGDLAKKTAEAAADPAYAKAFRNMGKSADSFTAKGLDKIWLAPTKAGQAAEGQRALLKFAGHPLIKGEKTFERLGVLGKAIRGSGVGQAVGDIFDYAAPLRKTGATSESIETAVEGQRSLGAATKHATELAQEEAGDIYKGLAPEMRQAPLFEQGLQEVPTGAMKSKTIVEPVERLTDISKRVDPKIFSKTDETADVFNEIKQVRKAQETLLGTAKKANKGKGIAEIASAEDMTEFRKLANAKEELFDTLQQVAPDNLKDYALKFREAEHADDAGKFRAFYNEPFEESYKGGRITEQGIEKVPSAGVPDEAVPLTARQKWGGFDEATNKPIRYKEGVVPGEAPKPVLPEQKAVMEYQDEVMGFNPNMTPEQQAALQKHNDLMETYITKENDVGIETKRLSEMDATDDLERRYANLPSTYAGRTRSEAAQNFVLENGDDRVRNIFENAKFTKQRKYRETVDVVNQEFREKLGIDFDWFETDMLKIDQARAAGHARLMERARVLNEWEQVKGADGIPLVQRIGAAGEVPEGMQRLPGVLQGWAARPETTEFLERIAPKYSKDGIKSFTDLMEVPTSIWRGWATATPGFVGRNGISNFWQLFLKDGVQGLNPKRAWLTAEWISGKNLDATIVTKAGKVIDGHTFMREAARHDILTAGIRGTAASAAELKAEETVTSALAGVAGGADEAAGAGVQLFNPASKEFFWVKGVRGVNTKVEQHARSLGFLNDLMEGNSAVDAAINTKKFLFDYGRLTPKEKVLRTYAPFMTWTRKNIPLQVEQLIKQPGKFAGINKVRRAAFGAFGQPGQEYTPGYFDEMFAMPTPFHVGQGQMWLNPDLPFQDLQTLTQPKDIWSMLNPLFKAPIELGLNKEMFFDRPIESQPGIKVRAPALLRPLENIPGLSKLLGMGQIRDYYSEDPNAMATGMNPRLNYLFRQIPMLNTLSKLMDFDVPIEKQISDTLSGGAGLKFFGFNPEAEKTSVGWENVKQLQDYFNLLQRQYGIDLPSMETIANYLRYTGGVALPSSTQYKKGVPGGDYLEFLKNTTGTQFPLDLASLAAFKEQYDAGLLDLPGIPTYKKPPGLKRPSLDMYHRL